MGWLADALARRMCRSRLTVWLGLVTLRKILAGPSPVASRATHAKQSPLAPLGTTRSWMSWS